MIRSIGIKKSLGAARMDLVSPFQNDDRAQRFNTEAEESRRQQNAHAAAVTALPHAVQRALIDEQRGTPPAQVLPITKRNSVNKPDIAANTAAVMAEIIRKGRRS